MISVGQTILTQLYSLVGTLTVDISASTTTPVQMKTTSQ